MIRIIMLISFLMITTAFANDKTVLNQKDYVKVNDRWYQVEPNGQQFEVEADVITVKFRQDVVQSAKSALHTSLGTSVLRSNSLGYVDIKLGPAMSALDVAREYQNSVLIESAEVNTIGFYTIIPDDNFFPNSWHLSQGSDADMDVPEAWDIATGSSSVIVGILDSGTQWDHADMGTGSDGYENIWLNPGEDAWANPNSPGTGNGADDDGNGLVDDWKGYDFGNGNNDARGAFDHGTLVAGIVSAKTNNNLGVSGIAGGWNGPGAQLMTLGVGDFSPIGSILDDAILYAAEHGAHIITMSLTVGASAAIDAAVNAAYNTNGVFIDCASGNTGGVVTYPASLADIAAIGSTNISDQISGFSSRGVDQDLAAPGENIWSCTFSNGYTTGTGTSFSAPATAGVAALMLSANSSLTNDDVRQLLRDTADKVGPYNYNWNAGMPGHSQELGYGRINAAAAVAAAAGGGGGIPCADVTSFVARCNNAGSLQMRARFVAGHNGETATFTIDGTDVQVVTIANNRAQLSLPNYGVGPHTVSLSDPAGCFADIGVTCTVLQADGSDLNSLETIPDEMVLQRNYPNPFNPTTSIRYGLNEDSNVKVRIYNTLGQLVATLVDDFQQAGYHTVQWNGRNDVGNHVASGIYIYRMEAGDFADVQKMFFTK